MENAIKAMGYKTQVQPLSHFHDDYGLEGDEGDEDEMSIDGEDEGSEGGSDEGSESE
jgi:hypothetical protein